MTELTMFSTVSLTVTLRKKSETSEEQGQYYHLMKMPVFRLTWQRAS